MLVFYTHHRPHLAQRDMEFFDMAQERGWKCEKVLTERFPVRFLGCSEVSSLRATSMFRHRRCLAHVSGGPGRRGGALDRARMEAHTSGRRWMCIFRFSRMKSNPVQRCAQTDKSRHGTEWIHCETRFFPERLTPELYPGCRALAWTFQLTPGIGSRKALGQRSSRNSTAPKPDEGTV